MKDEKNTGSLELNDERVNIIRWQMAKIAYHIRGRKLDYDGGCLTKEATMGFNLACDFLADELTKIQQFDYKDAISKD